MKRMLAAAAVAILAALLAACSGSAATPAQCAARYNIWKTGPARAVALKAVADLSALDIKAASADATQLQAMPMPACADPAGYWPQFLRRVSALGSNESLGIGYILAQMQPITDLENKLGAELLRTVPGETK